MATRKTSKRKKAVQKGAAARGRGRKATARKAAPRTRIEWSRVDAKLRDVMKLARELEAQGVNPDEIAARVKSELAGLGEDVVDGILRLAGGSIHVNVGGRP